MMYRIYYTKPNSALITMPMTTATSADQAHATADQLRGAGYLASVYEITATGSRRVDL